MSDPRARDLAAVLARPHLWGEGLRALFRLARRRWWRRWPPVPVPDPAYVRWRTETAYGASDAVPADRRAADAVSYLEYCRALRRQRRR